MWLGGIAPSRPKFVLKISDDDDWSFELIREKIPELIEEQGRKGKWQRRRAESEDWRTMEGPERAGQGPRTGDWGGALEQVLSPRLSLDAPAGSGEGNGELGDGWKR